MMNFEKIAEEAFNDELAKIAAGLPSIKTRSVSVPQIPINTGGMKPKAAPVVVTVK